MKKTNIIISATCLFLSFSIISCASTKKTNQIASDSYDSTDQVSEIMDSDKVKVKDDETVVKPKKKFSEKKSYEKNEFEKFFTFGNKDKFIKADVTSTFSLTVLDSIKQQQATILITTDEEHLAGFGSQIMSNYYIVLFDEVARKQLLQAKENYFSDFENKKLNRKGNKSFKQYGTINSTLNWGPLSNETPNFGKAKINLGYEFVKQSPYFTISAYPTHNDYYEIVGDTVSTESMRIKFFFTKAQLNDLVNMISEENIAAALSEYFETNYYKSAVVDEYDDSEETLPAQE